MVTEQPAIWDDTRRVEALMRRAIALAANGPARGVNPQVGCVITDAEGTVLAEGWHRGAGTAHAEVDALSKLTAEQTRGATAIVTLEPCNHTGRTGPCARALIDAGIAAVIYAVADPGRASSGGAQTLRDAGIDVTAGVLEPDATAALGDWLETARRGRPRVTVKWAQSIDGRVAAADGTSKWITGPVARDDVHVRRAVADAIAVGTGTLLADDPALTARTPTGELHERQPIPVVFGHRRIPVDAAILRHPESVVTLDGDDLAADLGTLRDLGIRSLFVEGGPTLASALVAAGLVDEYLVYIAPSVIGGRLTAIGDAGVATIAEAHQLQITDFKRLGDDILLVLRPAERTAHDPDRPKGSD